MLFIACGKKESKEKEIESSYTQIEEVAISEDNEEIKESSAEEKVEEAYQEQKQEEQKQAEA